MKNLLKKRQSIRYNGGQIVILNTILFLAISLLLIAGIAYPVISHYSEMRSLIQSKQAFLATQSAMDEGLYRLKNGLVISSPTTINLTSSSATITISDLPTGKGKKILVNGTANDYQRNAQMDLSFGGTGIAFHYGIQAGNGGFELKGATITGNVFSNGSVIADSGSQSTVSEDVISSGPLGLIDNVHVAGSAYAHTIQNSSIGKNAYYVSIDDTKVSGVSCPNANCFSNNPDQLAATMPVSDADITQWKADAEGGGVANTTACPDQSSTYTVSNDIIGPLKIPCNLMLSGNVTIRGTLWVTGTITTSNGSIVCLAPSYGSTGGIILADGYIGVSNGVKFQDLTEWCSTTGYILLLTTSAADPAIDLANNVSSVIINAQKGTIHVKNLASAKELTAYKIIMDPNSSVEYETGLKNSNFSSGPGGGYNQMGWSEI